MITYEYEDLFKTDSIDKQFYLKFFTKSGSTETITETIGNSQIYSESFQLDESLCSDSDIIFGSCESSCVKMTIANHVSSFKGRTFHIDVVLNKDANTEFRIGTYKVVEDTLSADRTKRSITAYDCMYDMLNADVADWYNALLPESDSTITLKGFRDNLFDYFGVEQEEITLVNDSAIITRNIDPSKLSGKDVLTAICEINGCFGHITRDNKFRYVMFTHQETGLYPNSPIHGDTVYPANDLYPKDYQWGTKIANSLYTSCKYSDEKIPAIEQVQVREDEDDIGALSPSEGTYDNTYVVEDNFLAYGMGTEALQSVADNLFTVLSQLAPFRTSEVEAVANPCLEVGDAIRLITTYTIVETYILQRTLKGVQALYDTYKADASDTWNKEANGISRSVEQLKGKTNRLTRTVDETVSEIETINKDLEDYNSRITQNATTIATEVSKIKFGNAAGKNLLNWTRWTGISAGNGTTTFDNDERSVTLTATANDAYTYYSSAYQTRFVTVSANTTYVFSWKLKSGSASGYVYLFENGTTSNYKSTKNTTGSLTITTSSSATWLSFRVGVATKGSSATYYDLQIEEIESGKEAVATDYEPFVSSNLELNSSIEQNAEQISLKVSKSNLIGDINTQLTMTSDAINFSTGDFTVTSKNFNLDAQGNASFSGSITGSDITLGGKNTDGTSVGGSITINNSSGTAIGSFNTSGISITDGSISGGTITGGKVVGSSVNGSTINGATFYGGTYNIGSFSASDKGAYNPSNFTTNAYINSSGYHSKNHFDIGTTTNGGQADFYGDLFHVYQDSNPFRDSDGMYAVSLMGGGIKIANPKNGAMTCRGGLGSAGTLSGSQRDDDFATEEGNINLLCDRGVISYGICDKLWVGGNQVTGSDIRLKDNVNTLNISESENLIYNLRPVSFVYKKTPNSIHHGFIAQEAQKLSQNWNLVTEKGTKNNYLGIAYAELIADLVNVVQSQNERIKALETKMEELNG